MALWQWWRTAGCPKLTHKGDTVSSRRFQPTENWQEGYAARTCCKRDLDGLMEYLNRQEEHHRKTTLGEGYRKLLLDAGIRFDERYMS